MASSAAAALSSMSSCDVFMDPPQKVSSFNDISEIILKAVKSGQYFYVGHVDKSSDNCMTYAENKMPSSRRYKLLKNTLKKASVSVFTQCGRVEETQYALLWPFTGSPPNADYHPQCLNGSAGGLITKGSLYVILYFGPPLETQYISSICMVPNTSGKALYYKRFENGSSRITMDDKEVLWNSTDHKSHKVVLEFNSPIYWSGDTNLAPGAKEGGCYVRLQKQGDHVLVVGKFLGNEKALKNKKLKDVITTDTDNNTLIGQTLLNIGRQKVAQGEIIKAWTEKGIITMTIINKC